jgi:hypothetical protein
MPVIDDAPLLAVRTGAVALPVYEPCATNDDIKAIDVKAYPQAMHDQARGDGLAWNRSA